MIKKTEKHFGRVISGDCLKVMSDMDKESVDLVLTDPPYAINYRSNRRIARPKFDHLDNDRPGDWIEQFAVKSFRVLKNNRHLYCFCRHDTYPLFFKAFEDAGFKMKRTLIWIKENHGSGDLKGDYSPRDEWIIYAHKGRRILNGKRPDNILEYPKVNTSRLLHPTEKPVDLLKFVIEKSTDTGEIVLDPYAGVLSTAVAAIQVKRSFVMIDTEAEYLEKGRYRLEKQNNWKNYYYEN